MIEGHTILSIRSDVVSQSPDKNGKHKLIKSNIITRKLVKVHDITNPEEVFDNKGKILKNYCRINLNNETIVIKHSFDYIVKLIDNNTTRFKVEGFKYKNKK